MNEKTINRNLASSATLCVLSLLLLVVALIFNWVEIAIAMAIAALLQAYVVCLWLHRKRHPHTHFRRKATDKEA